jgi:4-hydroxy-4-methyl-2-oxoglutarate aldolase
MTMAFVLLNILKQKTFLSSPKEREALEIEKRKRLASGELGLDIYKMREKLKKHGLKYV